MMRKPWKLPYRSRMINDSDPGHQGPVCNQCAPAWLYRLNQAAGCPILSPGPYGGKPYRSPHYGTFLHEARVIQWACVTGNHEPITFYG